MCDSTVDTPAQQLCEGVLVQKDDTAVNWLAVQNARLIAVDEESELKKKEARASCTSTACIVRTYKDSFRVEYKTAD